MARLSVRSICVKEGLKQTGSKERVLAASAGASTHVGSARCVSIVSECDRAMRRNVFLDSLLHTVTAMPCLCRELRARFALEALHVSEFLCDESE